MEKEQDRHGGSWGGLLGQHRAVYTLEQCPRRASDQQGPFPARPGQPASPKPECSAPDFPRDVQQD